MAGGFSRGRSSKPYLKVTGAALTLHRVSRLEKKGHMKSSSPLLPPEQLVMGVHFFCTYTNRTEAEPRSFPSERAST